MKMNYWMPWVILLALNFNISAQELTPADIKFAARYIIYLEKKDSVNTAIINEYVIKSIEETKARAIYADIDSLQNAQLKSYDRIIDRLDKINLKETKKQSWLQSAVSFIIGFVLGRL